MQRFQYQVVVDSIENKIVLPFRDFSSFEKELMVSHPNPDDQLPCGASIYFVLRKVKCVGCASDRSQTAFQAFDGSQGIIGFDIKFGLNGDGVTRALGHLGLWDGTSYTHQAEDTRDYFAMASAVALWQAPA